MGRTSWIVFIGLCVVALGGLIFVSRGSQVNVDTVDQNKIQAASADNGNIADHEEGSGEPVVTIIEYGDYQCPGCGTAAPVIRQVVSDYADKGVKLIFRNFPLTTIHPNALAAASAAEAAGLQGKFWEMHDLLYKNQSAWENLSGTDRTNIFVGYAVSLGLDSDQFTNDLTSDAVSKKISYDTALAQKAGAQGTPTIIVNGQSYSDIRVEDGKATATGSSSSPFVWSSAENFENYVIKPLLEEAAGNE